VQEFTAPLNTTYKIECWGANGGNSYSGVTGGVSYTNTVYGGKGGYCSGWIALPHNISVYVYVGQSGEGINLTKTFNGGGKGGTVMGYDGKSGGGATDIRLTSGIWSEFNSLKTRILVAAGGGGAQHYHNGSNGGYAGGLQGQDGFYSQGISVETFAVPTGATQNSGGKGGKGSWDGFDGAFGIGGNSIDSNGSGHIDGSGGGGGYYGGGGASYNNFNVVVSGSGGSSFISGYPGCDAISESSTEDNIIHTGQPNHYSGYVFTNSVMIAGDATMPKPKGGTETGHSGDGYAIISWISPSL